MLADKPTACQIRDLTSCKNGTRLDGRTTIWPVNRFYQVFLTPGRPGPPTKKELSVPILVEAELAVPLKGQDFSRDGMRLVFPVRCTRSYFQAGFCQKKARFYFFLSNFMYDHK
jgi:hypothetical protein